MAVSISASVGLGGVNKHADVLNIQKALNQISPVNGGANPKLVEDGLIGPKTRGAILKFQTTNAGLPRDSRIDVGGPTLAKINALLGSSGPPGPVPAPGPKYSDANLYGPGGPAEADIVQDLVGDCYFVATLGSLARNNPKAIRDAIVWDPFTSRFRVRLYNAKGQVRFFWVTQADLDDNVARQGSSGVDNTGIIERIWPAVFETAFAKMFDTDPSNGLGEGYQQINGGFAADALVAITGHSGTKLTYTYYHLLGTTGSVFLLGSRAKSAMQAGKSLTLSTDPETGTTQDGLADDHVYMVQEIVRNGFDWNITLRNPWGHNINVGEGTNTPSPTQTVSLRLLVDTLGLESIDFNR